MATLIRLKTVESTNTYLKNLASAQSLGEGTIVSADFQEAGRGQKGNFWESQPNQNLLFSILLYPTFIKASSQFILSQAISLAIKEVIDEYVSDITIKWPNDIYWNDKKIAGILIENELLGNTITQSIVGVGININQELFKSDAPNPISLSIITGNCYNLEDLLKKISDRIMYRYQQLKHEDSLIAINSKYQNSLYRKAGFYTFEDSKGKFSARILGVNTSGLLSLERECGVVSHHAFKEIKYII